MKSSMVAKIYSTPYGTNGEIIGYPKSYKAARAMAWEELCTRDQMVVITDLGQTRWKFRLDDNLNMIAIH